MSAARSVHPIEPFEYAILFSRRNARTFIRHGQFEHAAVVVCAQCHPALGFAELDRVVEQVEQRRLDLNARAAYRAHAGGLDCLDMDLPLLGRLRDAVNAGAHDIGDLDDVLARPGLFLEA